MEPVGLISSVITLVQVITEGVKYAKTFYRAQKEFHILQEQLENFTKLVEEINNQGTDSSSPLITTSLSKAKLTLQQLEQLVQVKIRRNVNGTDQTRRRAWARNKSKIGKIQDALKEHRLDLLAAISSNTLSSTKRSEATLSLINRDVGCSKDVSLRLDQRLSDIQKSISETHHIVLSQRNAVRHILESSSANSERQVYLIQPQSSAPGHLNKSVLDSAIENASSYRKRGMESLEEMTSIRKRNTKRNGTDPQFQDGFPRSQPTSSFEVSSNFFPEMYTVDQQLPISSLLVTSACETSSSDESRTNFYRLFYLESPRQWRRLNISIDVCWSSIYWAVMQLSKDGYNAKDSIPLVGPASLPHSLVAQIQKYLSSVKDLDEDNYLQFSLLDKVIIEHQYHTTQPYSLLPTMELPDPPQEILAFLDDLGCPRYTENELALVALIESPNRFVVCVDGKLAYETKFARFIPSDEFLYNIRLLRCMESAPGFAKLLGIAVDISGKRLKSYLVEFPKTKWSLLSEEVTEDRLISWKRREKWARQLIEAVSQVHSKGFVVGTLWFLRPPILIDGLDNLQLWRFMNKFLLGYALGCYYPPEFRHYQNISQSTSEAECPDVTAKSDIFHLGMILWYLAEHFPGVGSNHSPVCMGEGCNNQLSHLCDESHINPIGLPHLPKSIPQYYRDIVNLCRAKDRNERPAAWRLLELFPPKDDSACDVSPEPDGADLGLWKRGSTKVIVCDYCRNGVENFFFHCNICQNGNFDMCSTCYDRGFHCYESEHLLVEMEMSQMQSWTVSKRYHSCMKSSGSRDIMEL